MASKQIHFIAVMYPDPEKVDRLVEIIETLSAFVHDHEPFVWQYEFYKSTEDNRPVIVVTERFSDQAHMDIHMQSEAYQKFKQVLADEKICVQDHKLYFLSQFAGWKRT